MADERKHLADLENILQRYQGNDKDETSTTIEEMYIALKGLKIAVVGGNPKWQANLKERFPGYIFIGVEDLNKPLESILSWDYVCFTETVNKYALYYKVKSIIENTDIKIYFCGGYNNIELKIYMKA